MLSKHIIIQISDTHLFGDKNRKINGYNSYNNLKNILEHIKNLSEKPDCLVVSGDLTQDGTFESYQHVANLLNKLGIQYFLLPGNHDDVEILNKVFDSNWILDNVDYFAEIGNFLLYFIDSTLYRRDEGAFSEEQLIRFENKLKQNKNKPVLVFMHHHPMKIDSPWKDAMMLINYEKFNSVVERNPQIKAVLYGHIHQVFESNINGTFYGSVPSTSYQIHPKTEVFTMDTESTGYRIIELNEETFTSKVVRVEANNDE